MSGPAFVHTKDVVIEQLDPGITRQVLGFGESRYFRFEVDSVFQELGTGGHLFSAPNLIHGSTCIEAGMLIDNFRPMRADFLGEADYP